YPPDGKLVPADMDDYHFNHARPGFSGRLLFCRRTTIKLSPAGTFCLGNVDPGIGYVEVDRFIGDGIALPPGNWRDAPACSWFGSPGQADNAAYSGQPQSWFLDCRLLARYA